MRATGYGRLRISANLLLLHKLRLRCKKDKRMSRILTADIAVDTNQIFGHFG